jgi:type II secretory pathway component PulJ
MINVDWTISIGNIITVVILSLGALSAYYQLKGDFRVLNQQVTGLTMVQEEINTTLGTLTTVLTQLAVQEVRLNGQDHRFARLEKDLDDLRAGEGFKLPFPMGGRGPK